MKKLEDEDLVTLSRSICDADKIHKETYRLSTSDSSSSSALPALLPFYHADNRVVSSPRALGVDA